MTTNNMKTIVLFFAILLATTSLFSQTLSDIDARKVDSLFIRWNKPNIPGCAIGIIRNDSLVYAKGYGMANLEYGIPINPSTIFDMASVAKQFTAYCVVLLARQGKIKLDEDIHVYLPWLSDFQKRITIRNLLNHTSGIREVLTLAGISELRKPDGMFTQDLALTLLKRQRTLNFIPGEEFLYSNSNFILLSEIVKTVSGKSFRAFADSAIFRPLGMSHTFFRDDHTSLIANRSYAYNISDSNHFTNAIQSFPTVGDGGLFTNIEDMALWISNFYNPRAGDIKDIEQLTEKGKLNNGKQISYASGIDVNKYKGWRVFEHTGGGGGYATAICVFPDAKMGFLVFFNSGSFDPLSAIHNLANVFINEPSGSILAHNTEKIDSNLAIIKDTVALRKLAGSYISGNGIQFTFRLSKNKFYTDIFNYPHLLGRKNTDTFFIMENPDVRFYFSKSFDKDKSCIVVSPPGTPEVIKQFKSNLVLSDKLMQRYIGEYYSSELNCSYEILLTDHHLILTNNRFKDVKLTFAGVDNLITNIWWMPLLKIINNTKNNIKGFEINGPGTRHLRFVKVK